MMKCLKFFTVIGLVLLLSACGNQAKDLHKQIRRFAETSELGTIEATVKKVVKVDDQDWYKIGDRKILFRCTAHLKVGFDLAKITPEDITIESLSKGVTLTLPQPELLAMNMPYDETELAYSQVSALRSEFSAKDRNEILKLGEENIRKDTPNMGVYDEAKKSATDFFSALLMQLGYENITINFKKNE